MRPALVVRGHHVLGHVVAELAPNDPPRLPVVQDPALLVVLSADRDHAHYARLRTGWSATVPPHESPEALRTATMTTLALRPTARSVIRYRT